MNQIEEIFRRPNIFIESIKEMQHEQSLKEIQSKLNQMTKIKDNLEATNEFKPNSSFLRQVEDTSLFGSIRLFGFSNNVYSYEDINCTSDNLNIKGEKKKIINKIIKINSPNNSVLIHPNIIKYDKSKWRKLKINQLEFYLDYETTCYDTSCFNSGILYGSGSNYSLE